MDKTTYGPAFHQHLGLLAHSASLFDEPHRVHHSAWQYYVAYECLGTVSLFSVWRYLHTHKKKKEWKPGKVCFQETERIQNWIHSTRTKFNKGIRSSSCFDVRPIDTFKFIHEIFQVLESEFLWVRAVTHSQVANASFYNVTKVFWSRKSVDIWSFFHLSYEIKPYQYDKDWYINNHISIIMQQDWFVFYKTVKSLNLPYIICKTTN